MIIHYITDSMIFAVNQCINLDKKDMQVKPLNINGSVYSLIYMTK